MLIVLQACRSDALAENAEEANALMVETFKFLQLAEGATDARNVLAQLRSVGLRYAPVA